MSSCIYTCLGIEMRPNSEFDDTLEDEEPEENTADYSESEGWYYYYWCRTSLSVLQQAEQNLLECVKTPYKSRFVNIGQIPSINSDGEDLKIWTLSFNSKNSSEKPIVLIHGLASGSALWALNFDDLASDGRPVHAIDLLGFGRSSRPNFSIDPAEAEMQLVDSLEAWRIKMKLEKFFMVGHSLGGFLSCSYAIRFPERVAHLILTDPWGFKDSPHKLSDISRIPLFHRMLVHMLKPLNPLSAIRLAGPCGPRLLQSIRADLIRNFDEIYTEDAASRVSKYIFHCNARNPTGETAFHTMMERFGWAKRPMNHRISDIDQKIPITTIFGAKSWVDHCSIDEIKEKRPGSYFDHHILDCGHHIYAAKRKEFSEIILKAISLKI